MIRVFTYFLLFFSVLALSSGNFSAFADTKIFLTPNSKTNQAENLPHDDDVPPSGYTAKKPSLFISKGQSSSGKGSFISKLFGKKNETRVARSYQQLKPPPLDMGFDFAKFSAEYNKAKKLDKNILDGTKVAQTPEEIRALAAFRKAPVMMAMVDDRIGSHKYIAALMQRAGAYKPKSVPDYVALNKKFLASYKPEDVNVAAAKETKTFAVMSADKNAPANDGLPQVASGPKNSSQKSSKQIFLRPGSTNRPTGVFTKY